MNQLLRLYKLSSQRKWDIPFLLAILTFELILSFSIVRFIPYTEIDWEAYMEEVSTWQEGERDYLQIRGGTGPLVYPAGFLYLYGALKWLAGGDGSDIHSAQLAFAILYVSNAAIVLLLYTVVARRLSDKIISSSSFSFVKEIASGKDPHFSEEKDRVAADTIWSWRVAMILCCLSKRIHSIFMLRLFNDAPAMFLLYISTWLFSKAKWNIGCIVYSLAVSIKMNILLFAPGLLLLLLQSSKNFRETIECLGICAAVQLVLGAPFLVTYPVSYIRKAFEFDRIFFYKWTVNWKFIDEELFISKPLSLLLLFSHVSTLGFFCAKWIRAVRKQSPRECREQKIIFLSRNNHLSPEYIIYTLFVSNYIGIVFARTLHYQFYSWYFHSLPFILWFTNMPFFIRIIMVGAVEYSFNVFPATIVSSLILQSMHVCLLISLWQADVPIFLKEKIKEK